MYYYIYSLVSFLSVELVDLTSLDVNINAATSTRIHSLSATPMATKTTSSSGSSDNAAINGAALQHANISTRLNQSARLKSGHIGKQV